MKNKTLLFILLFILLVGAAVTVYITQFTTRFRSRAVAATALSFSPASKTVNVGESVDADIVVDPGTNQVSAIVLQLFYDSTKLANPAIQSNKAVFPQTLEGPFYGSCAGTTCTISYSIGVGADPTKAVTTRQTVATVHFKAKAPVALTQVTFNTNTKVYSIAPSDQITENVLSSTSPLSVSINQLSPTPPVCQPDISSCQWDPLQDAVSYDYKVVDETGAVITSGQVNASTTQITFPSQTGKTYTCSINAVNACGKGAVGKGTTTCLAPSITPTPTVCVTPDAVTNLKITCPNCSQ